jgi:antitoxin HigA-1
MTGELNPAQHPGEVLLDSFILPRYQTMSKAAVALGLPINQLKCLVAGEARVNQALAWRLGRHFGPTVGFWLRLQGKYDRRPAA